MSVPLSYGNIVHLTCRVCKGYNRPKYGLYLGGWEHLYLGNSETIGGLPNQIFSEQPWVLVLFENIYCDYNALLGEQQAYSELEWPNSGLFCKLASPSLGIIQPLPMEAILRSHIKDIYLEFGVGTARDFQRIISEAEDSHLEDLRRVLIQQFCEEHSLFNYDWTFSKFKLGKKKIPDELVDKFKNLLVAQVPDMFLSLRFSELSDRSKILLDDLLEYEKEPLRKLRRGKINDFDEYLPYLAKRHDDHRIINEELSEGLDNRLEQILAIRNCFERQRGWSLLNRYFDAYFSPVSVDEKELNAMIEEVENLLQLCASEVSSLILRYWRIVETALEFIPYVSQTKALVKRLSDDKTILRDTRRVFRFTGGESRSSRKQSKF